MPIADMCDYITSGGTGGYRASDRCYASYNVANGAHDVIVYDRVVASIQIGGPHNKYVFVTVAMREANARTPEVIDIISHFSNGNINEIWRVLHICEGSNEGTLQSTYRL